MAAFFVLVTADLFGDLRILQIRRDLGNTKIYLLFYCLGAIYL